MQMNQTNGKRTGTFICFEGIDGSGKTTQARLLADRMRAGGREVVTVREPGGTRISDSIRKILLDPEHTEMYDRTEALLYFSARAQLVEEVIFPALSRGVTVITDRFGLSTLAYQGYGRGLDLQALMKTNEFATANLEPHITFICDIDAGTAAQRRQNKEDDRIESAGITFLERTREGYLRLAQMDRENIQILDASERESELHNKVCRIVGTRYPELFDAK